MKYPVITNSAEANDYTLLLIKEIYRFDIRAHIFINQKGVVECMDNKQSFSYSSKPIKSKHFKENSYDLIVAVGESFDKKMITQSQSGWRKNRLLSDHNELCKRDCGVQKSFDKLR